MMTWNWVAAERELRRAVELNPNLSEAHREYGVYLGVIGKTADAVAEVRLAHELDPLSTVTINLLGLFYYRQRDYDKSLEQWHKSLQVTPNSPIVHSNLFRVYVAKSMYDKAVAELEEAFRLKGRTQQANAIDASYKRAGFREVLRTRIQIDNDSSTQDYAPWAVAESYALLGEQDQAFAWLDKEYEVRSGLVFLKTDPVWDNIRSDPRFQELLHRIGLPE
jgi:Flp pilus assembly protein TadD